MKLSLSLKGYVPLCTLALTAPALSYAADMVVTAQPQEDSTSPTQGYLATTSRAQPKATVRSSPRRNRFPWSPVSRCRSGRADPEPGAGL